MDQEHQEPKSIYGLMLGDAGDWTLDQLDAVFRGEDTRTLREFFGLAVILGTAFDIAYGSEAELTNYARTAAAGIGVVLETRGLDVQGLSPHTALEEWCMTMASGGEHVAAMPTYRLSALRRTVLATLAALPGQVDEIVRQGVQQILAALDQILLARGVIGEARPAGDFRRDKPKRRGYLHLV
jgi:hypothetical protein